MQQERLSLTVKGAEPKRGQHSIGQAHQHQPMAQGRLHFEAAAATNNCQASRTSFRPSLKDSWLQYSSTVTCVGLDETLPSLMGFICLEDYKITVATWGILISRLQLAQNTFQGGKLVGKITNQPHESTVTLRPTVVSLKNWEE